jgi:hypothetical protein
MLCRIRFHALPYNPRLEPIIRSNSAFLIAEDDNKVTVTIVIVEANLHSQFRQRLGPSYNLLLHFLFETSPVPADA